jgi:Cu/Ag efflux pump CusA
MAEKFRVPPSIRVGEDEWMIVSSSADIPLVKAEREKAKKLGLNMSKFAEVKKLLLQGKKKKQIETQTGISRTSINKYIKLYEKDTQEAIKIVQ